MPPKTVARKWKSEEIIALIDAYKDQPCLYAVGTPNYHNKHLRAEALAKVGSAVREIVPDISDKECSSKFHSLRSQFNLENGKVKASRKSGTGTDDVSIPDRQPNLQNSRVGS